MCGEAREQLLRALPDEIPAQVAMDDQGEAPVVGGRHLSLARCGLRVRHHAAHVRVRELAACLLLRVDRAATRSIESAGHVDPN